MSDTAESVREFYRRQGAQFENRRIMALLEAWVNDDNGDFDKTLALIKEGETE